ncbi:phosphoadenosine phosphosulfate reductase [Dysgonomonas sp. GY75]|uniref:phosphoadenosine phosphosulfate reductase n=1 Tax=Dysgonomonas sp. GY75 TaxID=2780419 RepID=UPI001883ACAA|nr:phosphoadenosine phosphosulfate reductase [Dysgonomonas sp. GY75]MBF0651258.1 phosphoadenosine phosphosulfate reductase [Dysgonomonas sp. GY75]
MQKAIDIIKEIARQTDKVILFHSASGKDSIALLDLLHPHFNEIVCVYMFIIKDLEHINRYIAYAQNKYPKARYIQIPHYCVYSYIKIGFMGCPQNPKQKKYTLSELNDIIRERTGIEWTCLGFKQSDSMNRRLMLRGYRNEAICDKSKKLYPLSSYKNADILAYIQEKGLIKPERYGKRGQSSGTDIMDIDYLLYLKANYPSDLRKVLRQYPLVERIIFEYEYKAERNPDN